MTLLAPWAFRAFKILTSHSLSIEGGGEVETVERLHGTRNAV